MILQVRKHEQPGAKSNLFIYLISQIHNRPREVYHYYSLNEDIAVGVVRKWR